MLFTQKVKDSLKDRQAAKNDLLNVLIMTIMMIPMMDFLQGPEVDQW